MDKVYELEKKIEVEVGMLNIHSYGLYYKNVTIVNDNSSIISKWSFKIIDNARVIIYDHHRFIIQASSFKWWKFNQLFTVIS